jgi:hypothetical protein
MKCSHRALPVTTLAAIALTLSGCVSVYRPRAYPVPKRQLQKIAARAPVAVVVIPGGTTERAIIRRVHYVPSQLAEDVGRVLRDALKDMDVTVAEKADKTIKLAIDDQRLNQGVFAWSATVMLHVETESGYERIFEGVASSGNNMFKAMNAALGRSVANLLKDDEFIEYLKK